MKALESNTSLFQFKQLVHQHVQSLVRERIDSLKANITEVQGAANTDTKSSMGDKYETGRAMAMLEIENLVAQLDQANKQLQTIHEITPVKALTRPEQGAMIKTDQGYYYLSLGIGKLEVDGKDVFLLSAISPLAQVLINSTGDSIEFRGRIIHILDIA